MNETATPTPAVSPVPSDAQPEPAPVPAPQPQKSRKIFWPVLGIIGLLLIAGACIASIVVIKNTGVKPETSSQITPTPVVFQARVTYLVGPQNGNTRRRRAYSGR
jgi:flagellar basal body-associated protein FliL